MADIPQPTWNDMTKALDAVISAHAAVAAGIATHAQKEVAARDERRRALEAQRRLTAGQATSHA